MPVGNVQFLPFINAYTHAAEQRKKCNEKISSVEFFFTFFKKYKQAGRRASDVIIEKGRLTILQNYADNIFFIVQYYTSFLFLFYTPSSSVVLLLMT